MVWDQLLIVAEKVAVGALVDGLFSVSRLLNGSRIRTVDRGGRLIGAVGPIMVAASKGAAGDGQNGDGSKSNLFHFWNSSIFSFPSV
ncbi:conserved hypothetical protein [Mesorhizobium delmotii]|uniref:Uncharacterized protein n=1 Tax=Mesorhizobium delmotii TaxID=1631247 RepID=A0A2P9ABM6_9HYPH|nr:conserved hypothetical protein [Mesorhizobium delmotii]